MVNPSTHMGRAAAVVVLLGVTSAERTTSNEDEPAWRQSAASHSASRAPEPGAARAESFRCDELDILAVVLAHKAAIVQCVNEQKKKEPGLSGKLVMRWTIQTNGKAKDVSCQTSEFRSTSLASCLSGLIQGWNFPKPGAQRGPIHFPFSF
jgi:hypothetical protein